MKHGIINPDFSLSWDKTKILSTVVRKTKGYFYIWELRKSVVSLSLSDGRHSGAKLQGLLLNQDPTCAFEVDLISLFCEHFCCYYAVFYV